MTDDYEALEARVDKLQREMDKINARLDEYEPPQAHVSFADWLLRQR